MTARGGVAAEVTVSSVRVSAYTVPTDGPEADGTLAWDSTTIVVVEAGAETSVGIGWTYGPAACATLVQELLGPLTVGTSALDVTATHESLVRAVRNSGRPGMAAMAISAVDTALWDLKARLLGIPLHRLLGAVRDVVPVYGSGGFTTYDDETLERQLRGWTDSGIPRVKIKIGESRGSRTDRDEARARRARAVVGDSVELFVDANGAYTPAQAIRLGERLSDVDVHWFEEPVSSDDLDGLRRVRDQVAADVAAGEYGYDLFTFQRMCQAEAVDCLQIDVSRCGGITDWLKVSAVAAAHHLEVSAHCAPALHLAVAAATPGLRHIEWFADHVRVESLLFDGLRSAEGGTLTPCSDSGTGLSFRAPDADRFRVA